MLSSVLQEKVQFPSIRVAVGRQVGEGAFSFVHEAKEAGGSSSGRRFAVKKLLCQTREQIEDAEREIAVLRNLQTLSHANLLALLDSTSQKTKAGHLEYYLLLPLYYASMQQMIDAGPGYPHTAFRTGELYDISMGVLEGLSAIHTLGYRHCDLKPANVLLTHDHVPVIIDFGSTSELRTVVESRKKALEVQEYASIHSTISFRAPELLDTPSDCVIGEASDIWAYGCTMYAMLYSRTPFETPTEGVTPLAILSGSFTHPTMEGNTPSANVEYLRALIDAALVTEPAERATVEQLKALFPATRSESDRHLQIDDDEEDENGQNDHSSEQRKSGQRAHSPMASPRATHYAITTIPEDEAVMAEFTEHDNDDEMVPSSTATMRIDVEVYRGRGFPKRMVKKTAHLMMTHTSITLLKGGMHQSHRNVKFYGTTILGRAVSVRESDRSIFEHGLIIAGEPFLLQQEYANHRDGELDDHGSTWEVGFPSAADRAEWMTEIKKRCQMQVQELNERRSTMGRATFGRRY